LLGTEQPVAFDIKMGSAWRRSAQQRAAVAVIVAEIGAGAEGLALRSEHQGTESGVRIKHLKGGGKFSDQRDVEIIVRRPSDLDQSQWPVFSTPISLKGPMTTSSRFPWLVATRPHRGLSVGYHA